MEIIRFPTEIYQPLHISLIRPYLVLFLGKKGYWKYFFLILAVKYQPYWFFIV